MQLEPELGRVQVHDHENGEFPPRASQKEESSLLSSGCRVKVILLLADATSAAI